MKIRITHTPKAQTGTFIKDNLGQWAHTGKNTLITGSNRATPITMRGVPYPVLVFSNLGEIG